MPDVSSFLVSFTWGLVVLVSLVGWGRLMRRQLAPGCNAGWGMEAAWGMSAVLVLGGPLLLAGLATRGVLIAIALCGLVTWVLDLRRPGWPATLWFGAGLLLLFVPYVQTDLFNRRDDYISYVPFVREILDTGGLGQPFSLRRLSAHGGHSLLQALTLCFGSARAAALLDSSLAPLILAGMAWRLGGPWFTAAVSVLPQFHQNTASQMTGGVMFLALYRTLASTDIAPGRKVVLAAMMAAASASLRNHYLLPALLLYPLVTREWKLRPLLFGLLAVALLVPWMAGSNAAVGAWLFPLQLGNQNPSFGFTEPLPVSELAAWVGGFFVAPTVLAFLLPPLVMSVRDKDTGLRAFTLCTLVTCFVLQIAITRSEYAVQTRYAHCVLLPAWILGMHRAMRSPVRWLAPALVAGTWVLFPLGLGAVAFRTLMNVVRIAPAITESAPLAPPDRLAAYRNIEDALPQGSPLFVMVPEPFLFDFARHRIVLADLAGIASPGHAMPIGRGPLALRDYLLGRDLRFVAYGDFNVDLGLPDYYRPVCVRGLSHPDPIARIRAPITLDVMENLEVLKARGRVLVDQGSVCAFELR